MSVKAKKHLGQHFLTDENIAKKSQTASNSAGMIKSWKLAQGWVSSPNIF